MNGATNLWNGTASRSELLSRPQRLGCHGRSLPLAVLFLFEQADRDWAWLVIAKLRIKKSAHRFLLRTHTLLLTSDCLRSRSVAHHCWWLFPNYGKRRLLVIAFLLLSATAHVNSNQLFAERFGNGFGFGMHLQLFVNVFHVKRNCMHRCTNFLGGGFVVMAFHQQPQQPQFMRR